jgi:hypothetical protein
MKRLPTLDETESGHDHGTAYLTGDTDALDALDAAVLGYAQELADEANGW